MQDELKVLIVSPYYSPAWSYGGIPRVAYELSKNLIKEGCKVRVYTTDVFDEKNRYEHGGATLDLDGAQVTYFKNLSNFLAYNLQLFLPCGLKKTIKKEIKDFDIIHLHGHRNLLNNIVIKEALKYNKKIILSGHGTVLRIERRVLLKRLFDFFFGNDVIKNTDMFHAVSKSEISQFEEFNIDKDKTTVIANGIEIDDYNDLPEKNEFRKKYNLEEKEIILYLGKITPRKGLRFLVRSFSLMKRKNAVLVVAGNDMGFKREVINEINKLGLQDKVIFTGLLEGRDKYSAYKDCDVLVYPSTLEIFGLVPFEAIMCGAPVIVCDDCGCGEIIEENKIGYVVKYDDEKSLKNKIKYVLENKNEAIEKTLKGKEYIKENLSWNKISKEFIELYNKMTDENK